MSFVEQMKVSENVYKITVDLPFAVVREVHLYYIHDEKPALIESGPGYGLTQQAFTKLEQLGFNIKNVLYLIPSHEHPDHIGGNVEVKHANPLIKIGAHPLAEKNYPHMTFSPPSEALNAFPQVIKDIFKKYENQPHDVAALGVDFHLNEGDVFDLGARKLKILHMPGHAPGHIGMVDEKNKLFFAGDNITGTGTPYIGGLSQLLKERDQGGMIGGNLKDYFNTLDRIEALDVETLLPAHGPVCGKERVKEIRDRKLSQVEEVYGIIKKKGAMDLNAMTSSLYNVEGMLVRLLLGSTAGYVKYLMDNNRVHSLEKNGEAVYAAQ